PYRFRSGLKISKLDDATIVAEVGAVEVNGAFVQKLMSTKLGMATNGDWIGGISNEGASQFVHVYIDANGNLKLHNKAPNYPAPDTGTRVATMLVNQAGWNGTSGAGLNAASVVYDSDAGEGNIAVGMLLGVYGSVDTDYSAGRGKG